MISPLKPEYIWRPGQLFRRAGCYWPSCESSVKVRLPWGHQIVVNPNEAIGSCICRLGIHDLTVCEAIKRLLPPGGSALDGGANIGQMTLLMAHCVGPEGIVRAFEPHPKIRQTLRGNLAINELKNEIEVKSEGISDHAGKAKLVIGKAFATNNGIARLEPTTNNSEDWEIPVAPLDALFPNKQFDLWKLDLEGHEYQALLGGKAILESRRVRHIVFEDLHGPMGKCVELLESYGFTIFSLGRKLSRPTLDPMTGPHHLPPYGMPEFLATIDSDSVRQAFEPGGWEVLA